MSLAGISQASGWPPGATFPQPHGEPSREQARPGGAPGTLPCKAPGTERRKWPHSLGTLQDRDEGPRHVSRRRAQSGPDASAGRAQEVPRGRSLARRRQDGKARGVRTRVSPDMW